MHEAVFELLAGNERHAEQMTGAFDDLQDRQRPEVVTVCCGDSRVLQDDMWDNHRPGRVFTHSNIGNRVVQETHAGRVVAGDVLYPLVHTDTHTAIVVGHTGCGAVTAAYRDLTEGIDEPAGIGYCVDLLETEIEAGLQRLPDGLDHDEAVNRLVEYNVDRQIEFLHGSDDLPDAVDVVGTVYDLHDVYTSNRGEIHVVNVNSVRDVERLRERYPEMQSRIRRLWSY